MSRVGCLHPFILTLHFYLQSPLFEPVLESTENR